MNPTSATPTPDQPTPPDTGTAVGIGSSAWLASNAFKRFRLTVTDRSEATISGFVEEVTAWDGETNEPCNFEQYLRFYMKWDECCHVWFGEGDEGKQDGYLHLCGAESWRLHTRMMDELFQWAAKTIPMRLG